MRFPGRVARGNHPARRSAGPQRRRYGGERHGKDLQCVGTRRHRPGVRPDRRVPAARARAPRRGDRRRYRGRARRCDRLGAPGPVGDRHDHRHAQRLHRPDRRFDGPAAGPGRQVRCLPRLHHGPGGRRCGVRFDRVLLRRPATPLGPRRRADLPGQRAAGVLRTGPGRGPGTVGEGGHRRARRAADPDRRRGPGDRLRLALRAGRGPVAARRPVAGHHRAADRARLPAGPAGRAVNVAEAAYAAGWRVVRALPGPVARGLFTAGADIATRRGGCGVARLRDNLRQVCPALSEPELDALVRKGMRSYLRYYLEAFRLPLMSTDRILRSFRLGGHEMLGENVAVGQGSVVALPHGGNWDLAGAWVAAMGWPIITVAERLRPEGLYQRFLDFRQGLGMEIIPLTGGERSPQDVLLEKLGKGYLVPLLADRDLPGRGVEVEFFGARTTMPAGPALLALRSGAPLYAVDMWYEPDAPVGQLYGPLPVPAQGRLADRGRVLTPTLADHLAAGIARHPEDWHMLQRMWR